MMFAGIMLLAVLNLTAPESAVEVNGKIFVSDIGKFNENDGAILELKDGKWVPFASPLFDPKGITPYNDSVLLVADVDKVWDVSKGFVEMFIRTTDFPVTPKFLNDITMDAKGNIYISDTKLGVVFVADKRRRVKVLTKVNSPNGLAVAPNGDLYIVTFEKPGKVYVFRNGKLKLIYKSDDIAGGDGIAITKNGRYAYISGYMSGKIVRLNLKTKKAKVIAEGLKTPADISLSEDESFLLVPMLEAGKFKKIKVKSLSSKR
ncbi:MAG: hypothetical protein DRQ10_07120 [Candidatus Hydrothermota bacterium]|nr:MAG: hypothetical protein DRQ10_07120 [Candidatus Hydrothermae bacterium]